jgi:hypothetical protein
VTQSWDCLAAIPGAREIIRDGANKSREAVTKFRDVPTKFRDDVMKFWDDVIKSWDDTNKIREGPKKSWMSARNLATKR